MGFLFYFAAEDGSFAFPPTPDSGSEMALYPSPTTSPIHSNSPTNAHESIYFFNGLSSPFDEEIGADFQRYENTRKRKVRAL